MTEEYSYFRAAGRALEIIKDVEAAKVEQRKLKKELREHFGAQDVHFFGPDVVFSFPSHTKLSGDWKKQEEEEGQPVFAELKPDAKDAFYFADMKGQILRQIERANLEDAFGITEMPLIELPDGYIPVPSCVKKP